MEQIISFVQANTTNKHDQDLIKNTIKRNENLFKPGQIVLIALLVENKPIPESILQHQCLTLTIQDLQEPRVLYVYCGQNGLQLGDIAEFSHVSILSTQLAIFRDNKLNLVEKLNFITRYYPVNSISIVKARLTEQKKNQPYLTLQFYQDLYQIVTVKLQKSSSSLINFMLHHDKNYKNNLSPTHLDHILADFAEEQEQVIGVNMLPHTKLDIITDHAGVLVYYLTHLFGYLLRHTNQRVRDLAKKEQQAKSFFVIIFLYYQIFAEVIELKQIISDQHLLTLCAAVIKKYQDPEYSFGVQEKKYASLLDLHRKKLDGKISFLVGKYREINKLLQPLIQHNRHVSPHIQAILLSQQISSGMINSEEVQEYLKHMRFIAHKQFSYHLQAYEDGPKGFFSPQQINIHYQQIFYDYSKYFKVICQQFIHNLFNLHDVGLVIQEQIRYKLPFEVQNRIFQKLKSYVDILLLFSRMDYSGLQNAIIKGSPSRIQQIEINAYEQLIIDYLDFNPNYVRIKPFIKVEDLNFLGLILSTNLFFDLEQSVKAKCQQIKQTKSNAITKTLQNILLRNENHIQIMNKLIQYVNLAKNINLIKKSNSTFLQSLDLQQHLFVFFAEYQENYRSYIVNNLNVFEHPQRRLNCVDFGREATRSYAQRRKKEQRRPSCPIEPYLVFHNKTCRNEQITSFLEEIRQKLCAALVFSPVNAGGMNNIKQILFQVRHYAPFTHLFTEPRFVQQLNNQLNKIAVGVKENNKAYEAYLNTLIQEKRNTLYLTLQQDIELQFNVFFINNMFIKIKEVLYTYYIISSDITLMDGVARREKLVYGSEKIKQLRDHSENLKDNALHIINRYMMQWLKQHYIGSISSQIHRPLLNICSARSHKIVKERQSLILSVMSSSSQCVDDGPEVQTPFRRNGSQVRVLDKNSYMSQIIHGDSSGNLLRQQNQVKTQQVIVQEINELLQDDGASDSLDYNTMGKGLDTVAENNGLQQEEGNQLLKKMKTMHFPFHQLISSSSESISQAQNESQEQKQSSQSSKTQSQGHSIHLYISDPSQSGQSSQLDSEQFGVALKNQNEMSRRSLWEQIQINEGIEITSGMNSMYQLIIFLRQLQVKVNYDNRFLLSVKQLLLLAGAGLIDKARYRVDEDVALFARQAEQVYVSLRTCLAQRVTILDELISSQILQYVFLLDFLYLEMKLQRLQSAFGWNSQYAITYLRELQLGYQVVLNSLQDAVSHSLQYNKAFMENACLPWKKVLEQYAPGLVSARRSLLPSDMRDILHLAITERLKNIYGHYQQIIQVTALMEQFSGSSRTGFLLLCACLSPQSLRETFPLFTPEAAAKLFKSDIEGSQFVKRQLEVKIGQTLFGQVVNAMISLIQAFLSYLASNDVLCISLIKYDPQQQKLKTNPDLDKLPAELVLLVEKTTKAALIDNKMFKLMSDPICPFTENDEYDQFLLRQFMLKMTPQLLILRKQCLSYQDIIVKTYQQIGLIIKDSLNFTEQQENYQPVDQCLLNEEQNEQELQYQIKFYFDAFIPDNLKQQYNILLQEEIWFRKAFNRLKNLESNIFKIQQCKRKIEFLQFKDYNDISTAPIEQYKGAIYIDIINKYHTFLKEFRMIMSSQVDLFQINFDDTQANIAMLDVLINELLNNETNLNILQQLEVLGEQIKEITEKPMRVEGIEIAKMQNELLQFQKHLQQLQFDFNKDVFRQIATECNNQKAEYKLFLNQFYDNNPLLNFYKDIFSFSNVYTPNNLGFNIFYFIQKEEKYQQLLEIKELLFLKKEDEIFLQKEGFHIKITPQHEDVAYTAFDGFYDYLQNREQIEVRRLCTDGDIECMMDFTDYKLTEQDLFVLQREMLMKLQSIAEDQIGYSRAMSKRLTSMMDKVDNIRRQIQFYGLFDLDIDESMLKDLHDLIYTQKIILLYVILYVDVVTEFFLSNISTIYTNYLQIQKYTDRILKIEKKTDKHKIYVKKIDFHFVSNIQELFDQLEISMISLFKQLRYDLQEQSFVQLLINLFVTVHYFINNQFQTVLTFNTEPKIIMEILGQDQCEQTVYSLLKYILNQLPMYQYYEKQFVSQKYVIDQFDKLMNKYNTQIVEQKSKLIVFNKKYQLLFFKEKQLILMVSIIREIEQGFIDLLSKCNILQYSEKIQKISNYLKQIRKLLREINQLYTVIKPLIKITFAFKQDISYFLNFLTSFQQLCDEYEDVQRPNCMKFLSLNDMKHESITYIDRFTDLHILPKSVQLLEAKPLIYSIMYSTKIYAINQIFNYYTLQDDQIQCATRASNVIRLSDDEKVLLTPKIEQLLSDFTENLVNQKMMMQVGFEHKDTFRLLNKEGFVQFHFDFNRINDIIQLFAQFIERFQIDDNIAYDNYGTEINTFTAVIQQLNQKVYNNILDNTEIVIGEKKHQNMNIFEKIKYCEKIINLEHYVKKGKYVKKLIMITQNYLYIPIKSFTYTNDKISGYIDIYNKKTFLYQPFPNKIEDKQFSFVIVKEILRQSIQKTIFKQQIKILKQIIIPGLNVFDFIADKLDIDRKNLIRQLTTIDIVEFNNLIHNLFQMLPGTLKSLREAMEMKKFLALTMEQSLQMQIHLFIYIHTRCISAYIYDNLDEEPKMQDLEEQQKANYDDFYENIIETVTDQQNIALIYLLHRLHQEFQHLTQNKVLVQQLRAQLGNSVQNVKSQTQLSILLRESIDQFISNTKLVDRSSHLKKLQMLMAQRDEERGLQYMELLEDIENLLQKNVIVNQIQFLLTLQIPNPYTLSCFDCLRTNENESARKSTYKSKYTIMYDPVFYIQNAVQKIENENITPQYSLVQEYLQKYSQISKSLDTDYQYNTIFFKSAGNIVANNLQELYDHQLFIQLHLLCQFDTYRIVYGKYSELIYNRFDELSTEIVNHFYIKNNNITLLNRTLYFSKILNKDIDIKEFQYNILKHIREDLKIDNINLAKQVFRLFLQYQNTKQIQLFAGLDYKLICQLMNYFQEKLNLKRQTYRFYENTLYLNGGLSISPDTKYDPHMISEKKVFTGNPLGKFVNDDQYNWIISECNVIDQLTRKCILIEKVSENTHQYVQLYPQPLITCRDQLLTFLLVLQVQLFEQNKMLSDYEIINDVIPLLGYDTQKIPLQISQDIIHQILIFQNNMLNPILEPKNLPAKVIQENLCIAYYNYLRAYHNLLNFYYDKDMLFTYVINNTDQRIIQQITQLHNLQLNIQQCDYHDQESFFNELYHVTSLCSVIIINVDEEFNFDVMKIMNMIHIFCSKQLIRVFCIVNSNDSILKISYKETAQFYRIMLQHIVMKNRRYTLSISTQLIKDIIFRNSYFKILVIQLQQLCQKQQIFQLYMNLLLQAISNKLYNEIYLISDYKEFSNTISSILLITQYITIYLSKQLYREENFQFSNSFCQHILIYTHQLPQQVNLDIFHFNDQDRIKSRLFLDLVDRLSHVNKLEILFKYFSEKQDHIFHISKHIQKKNLQQIGLSRNAIQKIRNKDGTTADKEQEQTPTFDFYKPCLYNQMIINNTYGHQLAQYVDMISLEDLKDEIQEIQTQLHCDIELVYMDLLINSDRFQRQEFAKLRSSILIGQTPERKQRNQVFVIVVQYGQFFKPRPDNILYQYSSKYFYRKKYGSDPFAHFNDSFRKAVSMDRNSFSTQSGVFNNNMNFIFAQKVTAQRRDDLLNWPGVKMYTEIIKMYGDLQEEMAKRKETAGSSFEQLMEKSPAMIFQSNRYLQQRKHQHPKSRQFSGMSVQTYAEEPNIIQFKPQQQSITTQFGIDPLIDISLKKIIPKINFDTNFLLDKYANILSDNLQMIYTQLTDCLTYERHLNTQVNNLDTSIQQLEQTNKIFEKTNAQYSDENKEFQENLSIIKKEITATQQKYDNYKKQIELVSLECERSQKLFDVMQSRVQYIEQQFTQLTPSIVSIFRHSLNPPELMKRLIDCLCILFNIPLSEIKQQVMQLTIPYIQEDTLKNADINDLLFIEATKVDTPCYFQASVKSFLSFIQCSRVCKKNDIIEFSFQFQEEQIDNDPLQQTQTLDNITNNSQTQPQSRQETINFNASAVPDIENMTISTIDTKINLGKSQLGDFTSSKHQKLHINVKKLQQDRPFFDFCRCRKTACYKRMLDQLQKILGNQFIKMTQDQWKDCLDEYITLPLYILKFNQPGYDYGQFFIDHELELHKCLLQNGCLLTNLKGYNKLNLTGHQFSAYNFYTYSTIVRRRCILAAQFWRTVFRQPELTEEDVINPEIVDNEPIFAEDIKNTGKRDMFIAGLVQTQESVSPITIEDRKQMLQEHFETKVVADMNGDRIERREKGGCNALTLTFHQPVNSFELVKKQLRNFFFTHLVDYFRPEQLTDEHIELITPYLSSPDCNTFTSSQTSVLATSLINWLNIVISLKKESESLDKSYKYTVSLQDELQDLQSEVDKTVIKLNDLQDALKTGQLKARQRTQAIEGNKNAKAKNTAAIENQRCLLKTNQIELDRVKQWKQDLQQKIDTILNDSSMQLAFQAQTSPQQVLKLIQQDFPQYGPQLNSFVQQQLLSTMPDLITPLYDSPTSLLEFSLQESWVWKVCGIEPKYCWRVGSGVLGLKIPVIWDGKREIEQVWSNISLFLADLGESVTKLPYYTQMTGADVTAELRFAAYRSLRHFFADFEEPALCVVFTTWLEVQEYALQLENFVLHVRRQAHPARTLVIVISNNPDETTQNIPQSIFTFLNGQIEQNIGKQQKTTKSAQNQVCYTHEQQNTSIIDLQSYWSRFESVADQVFLQKCRKEVAKLISTFWDVLLCQQTFHRKPGQTGAEQILIRAKAAFVARQGVVKQLDEQVNARILLYNEILSGYKEYKEAKVQHKFILSPKRAEKSQGIDDLTNTEEDINIKDLSRKGGKTTKQVDKYKQLILQSSEDDSLISEQQLFQLFDVVQQQHKQKRHLETLSVSDVREIVYLTQQELFYDISTIQWLNHVFASFYTEKQQLFVLKLFYAANSEQKYPEFDDFDAKIKTSNVADEWLRFHVVQAFQGIYQAIQHLEAVNMEENEQKTQKKIQQEFSAHQVFINAIQDQKTMDFIIYLTALAQLLHNQAENSVIIKQLKFGLKQNFISQTSPITLNCPEYVQHAISSVIGAEKDIENIIQGVILYGCGLFEGSIVALCRSGRKEFGYKLPAESPFPRVFKDLAELPLIYKLSVREASGIYNNNYSNNIHQNNNIKDVDIGVERSGDGIESKTLFCESRLLVSKKLNQIVRIGFKNFQSCQLCTNNVYITQLQKWFFEMFLSGFDQLSVNSAPISQLNHESIEQRSERRIHLKSEIRDPKSGHIMLQINKLSKEQQNLALCCIQTDSMTSGALLEELMRFTVSDVGGLWYQSVLLCVIGAAWSQTDPNAVIQAATRRLMLLSPKSQQKDVERVITDTLQLRAPYVFAFAENAVLAGKYKIVAIQTAKNMQLSLLYSMTQLIAAQQSIVGFFGPAISKDDSLKIQVKNQFMKDRQYFNKASQEERAVFPILGGPTQIPGSFQNNSTTNNNEIITQNVNSAQELAKK